MTQSFEVVGAHDLFFLPYSQSAVHNLRTFYSEVPDVSSLELTNTDVSSLELTNTHVSSLELTNTDVSSLELTNTHVSSWSLPIQMYLP